jgi:hypothetical protein
MTAIGSCDLRDKQRRGMKETMSEKTLGKSKPEAMKQKQKMESI